MTAEILRELQQLQRYATALHGLFTQAQGQAPARVEGIDQSGSLRVVLGQDGLPETIRVESGWERRLAPEAFAGAVNEAFSAAMAERLAVWTATLTEQGWQSRVDRLRDGSGPPSTVTEQIPPALRRNSRPVDPRPLDVMAEDMIKAFDRADQFVARPATQAQGSGAAAAGRLTLTVSQSGGLSVQADPQWVSRQSAAALMNALNEALAAARADLAESIQARQAAPAGKLDQLLSEALALLADPRRLADS